MTELGEYKAAIEALSPESKAALIASLRTRSSDDVGANLLAFLVEPGTAVNVAANLALLEQSGLGRTVAAVSAFDKALEAGFVDQGKDTVVSLAKLLGNTVRFGADTSNVGDAGDVLRAVDRDQFGGELPASVAALVPSRLRGDQSAAYLSDMSSALATYASTRAQNPAKFAQDVRYVVNKYRDELGTAYAKAEADGTLPEFYGQIAGRVAFEMATIILPTKIAKIGEVGNAVETLADTERAVDTAIDAAKIADVDTVNRPPVASPRVRMERIDSDNVVAGSREWDLLNNPPPNTRIELTNGNVYTTNSEGIVDEVTFQPRLVKQPRDGRQTAVGKLGIDSDVGGHIQACSLGGTCDRVNLFPQDANFNNSAYKIFENDIRRALDAEATGGPKVGNVSVRFVRETPSNPRPSSVEVTYTVGSKKTTIPFKNESGAGR